MTPFRPTRAPDQRLVRLGVLVDPRDGAERVSQVATMCERAGIDAVWLRDDRAPDRPRLDAWAALAVAAGATARVRLGMMVDAGTGLPATLVERLRALDDGSRDRLEIGVSPGRLRPATRAFGVTLEDQAGRLRVVEEAVTVVRRLGARVSVEAAHPAFVAVAVRLADDVVIPALPFQETRAALDEVRKACTRAGRSSETIGVAVEAPVSVGRTSAEARARADAEALFRTVGHPADVGVFGRLEECQDRVIELAHLGVADLRCFLPRTPDVHDVIAQLTAMVVGSTTVLRPDGVRSRAPDPPDGWGGRRH